MFTGVCGRNFQICGTFYGGIMKKNCIATEQFGDLDKHYFIDFLEARNHTDYIQITRSDLQEDGSYLRSSVRIFEENFSVLLEAFSMLLADVQHQRSDEMKYKRIVSSSRRVNGEKMRPREKLIARGGEALSDGELLAILIVSGTRKQTALELSESILERVDRNLAELGRLSVADLCQFKGMGKAKAVAIIAALELSERCCDVKE